MEKRVTDAADLIRSRRTISLFQTEAPPLALIKSAIDVARWAPNHRLTEPWHFYLLGAETTRAVALLNAELVEQQKGKEAAAAKLESWLAVPGWLVVTCENSDDPIQTREDYAACACAIQNFALYLWSEGVGTKWTTGNVTRDARFYDLIWVDSAVETVVGMIWYGYPAEVPTMRRKSVDEITVELP
jgi:nitroreductase